MMVLSRIDIGWFHNRTINTLRKIDLYPITTWLFIISDSCDAAYGMYFVVFIMRLKDMQHVLNV